MSCSRIFSGTLITNFFIFLAVLNFCSPVNVAFAQFECAGTLQQQDFFPEIKKLREEIQTNINELRKIESQMPAIAKGSAEESKAIKRMEVLKAALQEQKKTHTELNSPMFPRTSITAYGAACTDRRWVLRAKEVLVQKPENLGKHYYVWMDSKTREAKAALEPPNLNSVAR